MLKATGCAWVVLCSLTIPAGCHPNSAGGEPEKTGKNVGDVGVMSGVHRFMKVSDTLYRGGQPTDEGFAELKRMGIKTAVSLRVFHSDRKRLAGLGMRYVRISFKHVHPEDEDVLAFLKVATDPDNQPVFVHCRDGVDRTGMMVAVYRIIVQGWSKAKAMSEMKRVGFHGVWEPIEDYIEHMDVASLKQKLARAESSRIEKVAP